MRFRTEAIEHANDLIAHHGWNIDTIQANQIKGDGAESAFAEFLTACRVPFVWHHRTDEFPSRHTALDFTTERWGMEVKLCEGRSQRVNIERDRRARKVGVCSSAGLSPLTVAIRTMGLTETDEAVIEIRAREGFRSYAWQGMNGIERYVPVPVEMWGDVTIRTVGRSKGEY